MYIDKTFAMFIITKILHYIPWVVRWYQKYKSDKRSYLASASRSAMTPRSRVHPSKQDNQPLPT